MKKSAFSLMEVLMVLGIIGVITAMGVSISQQGMEKAYRQYWYTGYSALQDATFDAIHNNKGSSLQNYAGYVAELMKTQAVQSGSKYIISAPNGIKYTIEQQNVGNSTNVFYIFMQIPAAISKNQVKDKTPLVYNPSTGELYPAYVPANPSPITQQAYIESVNLQQRVDLLPFIINDGLPNSSSSHDKKIYNFIDAYCTTHNNTTLNPHSNQSNKYYAIDCGSHSGTPIDGIPVLVNPKKVF